MVDRPAVYSYDDLLALPLVEADVTLACVSNPVGGDLVGSARWLGVPLAEILERAGAQAGASQLVARSVDGWTAGFPTRLALDGREALIAVGMNGEPLPRIHGFPARLVVPGLYGYVSATKWLSDLGLTPLDAFDPYWVMRGWSKEGPVKTQSRIDVPRDGAALAAGQTTIASVAWAPTRGIASVEVSVNDGEWAEASLAEPLDVKVWRLWRYDWQAPRGSHRIRVRATDGTGGRQTGRHTTPSRTGRLDITRSTSGCGLDLPCGWKV